MYVGPNVLWRGHTDIDHMSCASLEGQESIMALEFLAK